jgi:archaellin
MLRKKGETGIGVLILLVALLVVASIVAGIIIQSNESLTQKALKDSGESRKYASSHAIPLKLEVRGDGAGTLTDFEYDIKLAPGSSPMLLKDAVLFVQTPDDSFSLNFRDNATSTCSFDPGSGYFTYIPQEFTNMQSFIGNSLRHGYIRHNEDWGDVFNIDFDLDGDNVYEKILLCSRSDGPCSVPLSGSYIQIVLSNGGFSHIPMRNRDGSLAVFNSGPSGAFDIPFSKVNNVYIKGFRSDAGSPDRITSMGVDTDLSFDLYIMPEQINFDVDDDGYIDYVGINDTHVLLYLSSRYQDKSYYWTDSDNALALPLNNPLGPGVVSVSVNQDIIGLDGRNLGNVYVSGNFINKKMAEDTIFRITPTSVGGYFCVNYLKKSSKFSFGLLQEGEILQLKFINSQPLSEDYSGNIVFLPYSGIETKTFFETPNIINEVSYVLFP